MEIIISGNTFILWEAMIYNRQSGHLGYMELVV